MRAALRILEREPQSGAIHGTTLNNLSALDLAHPRAHDCGECGHRVVDGWFLTQKGKAAVRGFGVITGSG